jgi:glycine/serine hydroxymethyltransferase
MMDAILRKPDDEALQTRIRGEVNELCRRFPFYSRIYPL